MYVTVEDQAAYVGIRFRLSQYSNVFHPKDVPEPIEIQIRVEDGKVHDWRDGVRLDLTIPMSRLSRFAFYREDRTKIGDAMEDWDCKDLFKVRGDSVELRIDSDGKVLDWPVLPTPW